MAKGKAKGFEHRDLKKHRIENRKEQDRVRVELSKRDKMPQMPKMSFSNYQVNR